ncbi:MAG: hypothetical protein BGO31_07535 [Bacteroidetes bacterium 43-16]|nr:MAG: hypothetical protein BGO31_07535 [Bacteroidetes bacterium 43-16]
MENNTNAGQIKMPDNQKRSQRLKSLIEETEQRRKASNRKIRILKNRIIVLFTIGVLLTVLPGLLGKKLTCEQMDTAPFYEKWHYYTHPLIVDPCDSTSPFWSPK